MGSRGSATAVASTGLGRRIREARVAQGLTQGDLAGPEFSVGYVSRIESGARQPSKHTLTVLAGRLGVTPDFLMTGAEAEDALARRHDVDRAELALAGGDVDEAVALTATLLENHDLSPWPDLARRARLVHALCYEAMGDLHSAIIELEDLAGAYGADEESAKVGIALSRCYRDNGDFPQAIEAGEHILRILETRGLAGTTEHIRLSVTVAAAYHESGHSGVAVRMARRAIKAAEANASPEAQAAAFWNASVFERRAGNTERAVELSQRALALLENGTSNRNIGRLRTAAALIQLYDPRSDAAELDGMLELARRELDWSSASPVDRSQNILATARVALRAGSPERTLELLDEVPADVCHQDPLMAASVSVVRALAQSILGRRWEDSFTEAAAVLTMLGTERGSAQFWFELGEAASEAGDDTRSAMAYRQAAMTLGAARILLPVGDRPAFSIPARH